jgi:hypothetical protein
MTYVFDTSSFSVLKSYYPSAFPTLWKLLDEVTNQGTIISVREVLRELEQDNRVAFVYDWANQHKAIFATPSNDELLVVAQILAIPHFQTVINRKALLKGTPVADPFIVAAAQVKGGSVITEETMKPNAAKIPNICNHLSVPCQNLEWFMQQQGWSF